MGIDHDSDVDTARFHNPMEDFEEDTVEIELRVDPLTGQQVRIVPQVFPRPDGDAGFDEAIGDPEACFFCPHSVQEATPTYPTFVGFDRGSRGEAVSFPNMFPYAKHSNVIVLTEDHFRPIDDLGAERLRDGLECALEYLRTVVEYDDPAFASVNMNLLGSAGSSVVHPHMQTMADDRGTNRQRLMAEGERRYYDAHGRGYWKDLLKEERSGSRYVGSTGDAEWIAPYAPTHQWQVTGVVDAEGIPSPDDGVTDDLATGIDNVLQYYADLGLDGFNFSLHLLREDPPAPVVVEIIARPAFVEFYQTDAFFFRMLHDERAVDVAPEEYAPEVAEFF